MASGCYVGGPEVEAFEGDFAAFCGAAHCIGVGNGLDALTIALMARGVGPGDEVIVPAHTFIATWLAVIRTGAVVVPVDVEPEHLLIEAAAVAAAITRRTAAIVPVHLCGTPVNLGPLLELASVRGLFVLGDAAQAHGARRGGRDVGALGDAAAFSFYPAEEPRGLWRRRRHHHGSTRPWRSARADCETTVDVRTIATASTNQA